MRMTRMFGPRRPVRSRKRASFSRATSTSSVKTNCGSRWAARLTAAEAMGSKISDMCAPSMGSAWSAPMVGSRPRGVNGAHGLEAKGETAHHRAWVAWRVVDVVHALRRLPPKSRGGVELRLTPVDVEDVVDVHEGIEERGGSELVAVSRPRLIQGVATRRLKAELIGIPVAEVAHGDTLASSPQGKRAVRSEKAVTRGAK